MEACLVTRSAACLPKCLLAYTHCQRLRGIFGQLYLRIRLPWWQCGVIPSRALVGRSALGEQCTERIKNSCACFTLMNSGLRLLGFPTMAVLSVYTLGGCYMAVFDTVFKMIYDKTDLNIDL